MFSVYRINTVIYSTYIFVTYFEIIGLFLVNIVVHKLLCDMLI